MPKENEIRVDITGDDKSLKSALKEGEGALKSFGRESDKMAAKAGIATEKTKRNFTGLSRVIQDAPFGFVAISNNLEQLLPAAGGAGLAISALTAALTFASVGFGAWTRGFNTASAAAKAHEQALKDARDALKEYLTSLDDVRGAQLAGNQNAQEDLVRLKTLYEATQNANIPLRERKKLVDELQDQYPKYFGNIKDETILAGGAKAAYDRLTTSILQTARARAAQDKIVEIQKDLLTLEEKAADSLKDETEAYRLLQDAQKKLKNAQNDTKIGQGIVGFIENEKSAQDDVNKTTAAGNEISKQRLELMKRAEDLSKNISSIVETTPDVLIPDKKAPREKLEKKLKEIFVEPVRNIKPVVELTVGVDDGVFQQAFKDIKVKPIVDYDFSQAQKGLEDSVNGINISDIFNDIATKATAAARQVATDAFVALGNAMAAALSGGSVQDVFKGLFQVIGNALQQLGEYMISLSPLIQAISVAIKAMNPALLLPAGIALVALGGLVKAAFAKAPGLATGGIIPPGFPNDSFPAMLTSGEAVIPINKLDQLSGRGAPSVVILNQRMRGRDMILQQSREYQSQRRGG